MGFSLVSCTSIHVSLSTSPPPPNNKEDMLTDISTIMKDEQYQNPFWSPYFKALFHDMEIMDWRLEKPGANPIYSIQLEEEFDLIYPDVDQSMYFPKTIRLQLHPEIQEISFPGDFPAEWSGIMANKVINEKSHTLLLRSISCDEDGLEVRTGCELIPAVDGRTVGGRCRSLEEAIETYQNLDRQGRG